MKGSVFSPAKTQTSAFPFSEIEDEDEAIISDESDDYDGQKKLMKQRAYLNKQRAKELKDIKFGNAKTKVVKFHKGKNDIHEADREKGSSIIANLTISKKGFKKGENPFHKQQEKHIVLDSDSMMKIGQVT